ncbi:MAG: hypothetical protein ACI9JD_000135 [Rhodococcus sp. (in: high G+C Gram-positive bacteria)]
MALPPAWVRKSPQMNEYFHCYICTARPPTTSDRPEQFLGSGAGLSAASITRLTTQRQTGRRPSKNATSSAPGRPSLQAPDRSCLKTHSTGIDNISFRLARLDIAVSRDHAQGIVANNSTIDHGITRRDEHDS